MQSGLPQSVRFQIAKDLNEQAPDSINIYDLVRKYCSNINAVSEPCDRPTNALVNVVVDSATCGRCNKPGHGQDSCFTNKHFDGTPLDPRTKTANGKRLGREFAAKLDSNKTKKPAEANMAEQSISQLTNEQKEQLLLDYCMQEMQNKGKISKYVLFFLTRKLLNTSKNPSHERIVDKFFTAISR
jgi:hypothetical protein